MKTLPKFALVLAAVASLAGCVSVPDNAGQDPSDPWETMNRNTFAFNQKLDTYVYRPVAKGYEFVVPEYARERIGNIYVNLNEPANAINNALQGKGEGALVSLFRLMINTTLGLGGMYDVAGTAANQPTRREDFGQTLAVWGVGSPCRRARNGSQNNRRPHCRQQTALTDHHIQGCLRWTTACA